MSRPLQARIDLSAIAENYRYAQSLGSGKTVAVIKANAYGHGLVTVGEALAGADALAVATIEEALALRRAGIATRLLVLEGVFDPAAQAEAAAQQLDLVVHSDYQLDLLRQLSGVHRLVVWMKIDTGMGRLGFRCEEARCVRDALQKLPVVADVILMTHMACADEPEHGHNAVQLQRFDSAAVASGIGQHSIANSAALMGLPQARREWNRAGIMLYGVNPLQGGDYQQPLSCTLSLESRVIAAREVAAGESIGYGGDFIYPHSGRYGVVACGYGDGYPRHAPSGTPVLVNGRRTRLVGRISMDMLAVDLSHLPDADVGSSVTLWGEGLPVGEVAEHAGTIAYELLTGLTERVPRIYRDGPLGEAVDDCLGATAR
ncbi:alanine racemase [Microbulbifer hainanensis]|uniref:alanine racemase n=1 Tax=Microbulbifer hainanensis TaxID=2735675 RepID=UPI0018662527|nr:alanine racemase [Microbulbifer hainanensis]